MKKKHIKGDLTKKKTSLYTYIETIYIHREKSHSHMQQGSILLLPSYNKKIIVQVEIIMCVFFLHTHTHTFCVVCVFYWWRCTLRRDKKDSPSPLSLAKICNASCSPAIS